MSLSKRQIFTHFADLDRARFNDGEPSICATLKIHGTDELRRLLEKKCGSAEAHIRTADSWQKKLQSATVSELTAAYELLTASDPLTVVVPLAETDVRDVAQEENEEERVNHWYRNALHELNLAKEDLREEQYRRRRAQLRVEYWARLDKQRNAATPTVINA